MLKYDIPGLGEIYIENVVFDYNGTIAEDGELIEDVGELLTELKEYSNVYILTADTYGTVREKCSHLGVMIKTFPTGKASEYKKEVVVDLGADKTICIGNGFNDIEMFKVSRLSIAVVSREGCSGKLLAHADVVVHSIKDAIDILLNSDRLKATLRE
ncbi:HAD family hydrolase [Lutispora thermophila]|uniref:ATPase, P-type (Transporting), HAD superfamily, subfamily IC n=1 Tax=Lutispora thermophila DSM 19022 TaxID=1122184 RepID=A0A1M6FFU4_9FIRM|nr:HAD family hydrolase [Lutispora thermophila]SHI96611.1 ATPase, P-type (transporting), HAD superfamily, subfamily IC [Lutispora thermophila DSM 19022]